METTIKGLGFRIRMEKKMETTMKGFGFRAEKMETTILGQKGTATRIHSFIPSYPKVSSRGLYQGLQGSGFRMICLGRLRGCRVCDVMCYLENLNPTLKT